MSEKSDGLRGMTALAAVIKDTFEKLIRKATFDKTGVGTVLGTVAGGYRVQVFGGEYIIYESGGYSIGQSVTVTAPQNNFNKLYMGAFRIDNNASTIGGIKEDLNNYKDIVTDVQDQLDGRFEQYFYNFEPTNDNIPANQWADEATKASHEKDIFFNTSAQKAYRWERSNGMWGWVLEGNSGLTQALCIAAQAKDTADGKRRIFITQPTAPYDAGDMWLDGSVIKVSQVNRSDTFVNSDWVRKEGYTDDTTANKALQATDPNVIFDKLTSNGLLQGVFDSQGKCYINATYIKTGTLVADLVKSGKLSSNDGSTYFDLDNNKLVSSNSNITATLTNGGLELVNGDSTRSVVLSVDRSVDATTFTGLALYRGSNAYLGLSPDYIALYTPKNSFLVDDDGVHTANYYKVQNTCLSSEKLSFSDGAGLERTGGQNLAIKASSESNYWLALSTWTGGDAAWNIHPWADTSLMLGCAGARFGQIYSSNSVISTSDETDKRDIQPIVVSKAKELLLPIKPVTFKFIDGTSGRTHWGFGAQSVEKAIHENGITSMDFAGLCYDHIIDKDGTEKDRYGLRYEEFIAPIVALLQDHENRINILEKMKE